MPTQALLGEVVLRKGSPAREIWNMGGEVPGRSLGGKILNDPLTLLR
jgi:hypothetical protein